MHAKTAYEELNYADRAKWDMQKMLLQAGILVHDRSYDDSYCDSEPVYGKRHVQVARLHGAQTLPPSWKMLQEYRMVDFEQLKKVISISTTKSHPSIFLIECSPRAQQGSGRRSNAVVRRWQPAHLVR